MASPSSHPRDPLHGITLETIVKELVAKHGWEEMASRIPVRCFQFDPSVSSSLTFLRKTPWARKRVEEWFIAENRTNGASREYLSSLRLTLPRVEGPVFVLDAATVEQGITAAKASPRRRIIMQLHRSDTEGVQRMLNFMQRGSYARPHCHPSPENIETVTVLQGSVGFFLFEATGTVRCAHRLEAGNPASCLVDIEPGVWHTLVPLANDTVVLEIKRGPYRAETDKAFADWSPDEGSVEASGYLEQLESHFERLELGAEVGRDRAR